MQLVQFPVGIFHLLHVLLIMVTCPEDPTCTRPNCWQKTCRDAKRQLTLQSAD